MRPGPAIALIVVVAAVLVVAWALFAPSQSTTVLAPTPTPVVAQQVTATPTPVMTGTSVSPSPSGSPDEALTSIVEITDLGFVPASVTVKAGTKVTFVNHGQGAHWPASDPHPTHTGLPGFDAKVGLATGDTYSFVFDKVGTWGYHDHLHSNLRGSITVTQ